MIPFIKKNSWVLVIIGSIVFWLIQSIYTKSISVETLITNAYLAAFLGMLAIGQMLVVTTGRGAIDLSVAGMVTCSAFISIYTTKGQDSRFFLALIVLVVFGVIVGTLNALMVIKLRLPSIIATMAMNYVLSTFSQILNNNVFLTPACNIQKQIVSIRILNIPLLVYVVLAFGFLMSIVVKKSSFGRCLQAMGQNRNAAELAGIKVNRIEIMAYVISSVLCAIGGMLIGSRAGGAFLGMGDSYTQETIAAVVLGGTLMSGGRAKTMETLAGCLFLYLVVSSMQVMQFSLGTQKAVKGILIIVLLLVGSISIATNKLKELRAGQA